MKYAWWAYPNGWGEKVVLYIFWTWITLKKMKKMNLKCFFHLLHLFQRNPGSKTRINDASPSVVCAHAWLPLIKWALIIVSAKWERCSDHNVGVNLMFALELKTFANNCSRANTRFAPTRTVEKITFALAWRLWALALCCSWLCRNSSFCVLSVNVLDWLIYELFTIPLANARGSDSVTRGSDLLACLVSEPRALASGIVNKPQVKHACRKDTSFFNVYR